MLLAPGLAAEHLGLPELSPAVTLPFSTTPPIGTSVGPARVPVLPKLFAYGCPTRAPGDNRKLHSVISGLLQAPLPEHIKKKRAAEQKRLFGKF